MPDSVLTPCLVILALAAAAASAPALRAAVPAAIAGLVRRERGERFDLTLAVVLAAGCGAALVGFGLNGSPLLVLQGAAMSALGLAAARVRVDDAPGPGPA